MKWSCKNCGNCCKSYPIDVTYSDIKRWDKQDRHDILQEISFIDNYPKKGQGGFYIEKTIISPKQNCPFFIDNKCSIYKTRPLICRDYPFSKEKSKCEYYNKIYNKRERLLRRQSRDFRKALQNRDTLISSISIKVKHSSRDNI